MRNYYCELCCVQAELNNNTKTLMVERLSAILSAVTFCSRVHSVTYMYMYVHAIRRCTCGHGVHVVNLCNETRDRQVAILSDLTPPVVHLTQLFWNKENYSAYKNTRRYFYKVLQKIKPYVEIYKNKTQLHVPK